MSFGQLTHRERDIICCLYALQNKHYHIGLKNGVKPSTISDANVSRDWRIYANMAKGLIQEAKSLYQNTDTDIELDNVIYALDSTTIELCLEFY